MTKHFSFFLSALGFFLVGILILKLFDHQLSFEFNKTFLIHTTQTSDQADNPFLSYYTGKESKKHQTSSGGQDEAISANIV
jgi:hypothetical protein